jgi:hypothetical protein
MKGYENPVDKAMESLAGRKSPEGSHKAIIQSRIMDGFDSNKPLPLLTRYRAVAIIVAFVAVSSFGFVAAGGVEILKDLFLTVEVNGKEVQPTDIRKDEQGNVNFTIPIDTPPGSDKVSIGFGLEAGEAGDLGKDLKPGEKAEVKFSAELTPKEDNKANVKVKIGEEKKK